MLRACFATLIGVFCTVALTTPLRAGVPVPDLGAEATPSPIALTCPALSGAFTTVAMNIQTVAQHARSAAFNAPGLGYFSPGRHFHAVEDDFRAARDAAQNAVQAELGIRGGLDNSRLGTTSAALLVADDTALRAIYRYAVVSLAYERAVNAKNLAEQTQLSFAGMALGAALAPSFSIVAPGSAVITQPNSMAQIGLAGANASSGAVQSASLSVAQVRYMMQSATPDIQALQQSLIAPTQAFNALCPAQ